MTKQKSPSDVPFLIGVLTSPQTFHRVFVDIPVAANGEQSKQGMLGALIEN